MLDIDRELDEMIIKYLSGIEADFGYAVGNLSIDTTPNSRKEIIEDLRNLIKIANLALLERVKGESQAVTLDEDTDDERTYYFVRVSAIDNIAKEIRGEYE